MRYYNLCSITDRESNRMILIPTRENDLDAYVRANGPGLRVGETEPRRCELPTEALLEFRAKGPHTEDLPMCFYKWIMSDPLVELIEMMQPGSISKRRISFDASSPSQLVATYWFVWCDLEIECHDVAKSRIRVLGNHVHLDVSSIDVTRVPKGCHVFRPRYDPRAIYVSSTFLAAVKKRGLRGVRYY